MENEMIHSIRTKRIITLTRVLSSNCVLSVERVEPIDKFVKAPLISLAFNNKIWSFSIKNFMTWNISKLAKMIEPPTAVVFKGRGNAQRLNKWEMGKRGMVLN